MTVIDTDGEDHPRGCGEKTIAALETCRESGSSPRVRGKDPNLRSWERYGGIIPAGAGKSPHQLSTYYLFEDHPRGCGEKNKASRLKRLRQGSSPRVRGKDGGSGGPIALRGIIPAGAGKSLGFLFVIRDGGDHPRGCGEKGDVRGEKSGAGGSSPRVRGKDKFHGTELEAGRIIPAGAGKRRRCCSSRTRRMDHPRGCGEKLGLSVRNPGRRGSSPRVRGKEEMAAQLGGLGGIIPAGAGKREGPHDGVLRGEDHPRGCGEKAFPSFSAASLAGSSPRVRGKEAGAKLFGGEAGIIPAGAGKSHRRRVRGLEG